MIDDMLCIWVRIPLALTCFQSLLTALKESGHPDAELADYYEDLLRQANITPDRLVKHYLIDFEVI
jgi:hypothetical protein